MNRRTIMTLVGGAAAWPIAEQAQQPGKIARIGFLGAITAAGIEGRLERFRAGLRDLGCVEGQNIFIDFRWAEGNYARLAEFATELIRLKVDVLVTYGTPGTLAAKQATTTVPIVMIVSGDAVATGIVASLARPGGNVTGSTFFDPELTAKGIELLMEVAPSARRIGVLLNPDNPAFPSVIHAVRLTAETLKWELQLIETRNIDELQSILSMTTKESVDAIAITNDAMFVTNARRIAEIMARKRVPSVGSAAFGRDGGLIGYGVNFGTLYYRAAYFVDRILKGITPADLPVEQPTKFELVINLKTAKALGIDIPATLLARADEVIE